MKKQVIYFLGTIFFLVIWTNAPFAQGPGEPFHPMTANGAKGISLVSHVLFWENPAGTIYNEIYFSEDSASVAMMDTTVRILNGYPSTVFNQVALSIVSTLNYNTNYFWKVVEYDTVLYTEGPDWYFTTRISPVFFYVENFSTGLNGWTAIGPYGNTNWDWSTTNNAGGDDYGELKFSWNPSFIGTSYIMSPVLPLTTAVSTIFVEFKHMVDWFADPCGPLGFAYTTDNGITWTSIWEITPNNNIGPELVHVPLQLSSEFRLGFYYSGDSFNIDYWYIDDVMINGPLTPNLPPDFLQALGDTTELGVILNWTTGFSPDLITGYRIQKKNGLPTDTSAYITIAETNSNTFSYIDENVVLSKEYTYRICTLSGPSESMWGNEATAYIPEIIPVELTSFTAAVVGNDVHLSWITATELNNSGFVILRFTTSKDEWNKISFVPGHGTATKQHVYSFDDESVSSGKYKYRLKQIDYNGTFEYSKIIEVEIGAPTKFSLEQNYPNPFNPTTKIKYAINSRQYATLKVYDVLGNKVATLVNEEKPEGSYEVEFNATDLTSGIYFYKLQAGEYVETKKMVLIR